MDGWWQDVRVALRALRRQKGLSAAALVTLALGIGANTALFSVAYGVLLRPLPYPEADRLVRLSEEHPGAVAPIRATLLSNLTYHAWGEAPGTLEGIAAYGRSFPIETGGPEAVRLAGASVSPALFPLLRARPMAGRLLVEDDALEGAPPVVVISDGLARERFAGAPAALGATLMLDGEAHTVVGVMPPGFHYPDREVRLWTPYPVPPGVAEAGGQSIRLFAALGRLRPGVSTAQASAEGTAAARGVERPAVADAIFGRGGPVEVRVRTLLDEMTAQVRPALLVLGSGVALVLLVCCANVANLLLCRGVSRRRELAVRSALGAGRGRLARQTATEGLVLAGAGGALGLGLAWALLRVLPAVAPADFPRLADVALDGRALAFAAAAALAAGVLAALLPALRAARGDLLPALREGAGGSAGSGAGASTRASTGTGALRASGGLLVLEAALAVVLLVGAGLLGRSFARLVAVDPGYEPGGVLVAEVYLGADPGEERARELAYALVERIEALPGVEAAGAANMAPLARATAVSQFELPPAVTGGEPVTARAVTWMVTPGYAEALSLRLVEGRFFVPGDVGSATRPLLVNESFARSYLAGGGPIVGRRFEGVVRADERPTEIVGVVADVLKDGLDSEPGSEIYALPQDGYRLSGDFYLAVRTARHDPLALAPALRAVLGELAPAAALEVATLSSRVSDSVARPRFAAAMLASFALLALVLAATGVYGVLSYNVSRRRREIGVRGALGADRGAIVGLVLRQGLAVTAAGLALGLAAAAAASRLLASLLFGVTPLDAVAFGAAPVLLLGVALAACLLPARRAAAVDPAEALRGE